MISAVVPTLGAAGRLARLLPSVRASLAASGQASEVVVVDDGATLAPVPEGARVLPLDVWHTASTGIDLLLGAFALGASRVAVLAAGSEAPEYRESLREQFALAETIVQAFGFAGRHFLVVSTPRELLGLDPAVGVGVPAAFAFSPDKRTAVEFAVEHLSRHSPVRPAEIALPE